jgi:hypothetical protein
MSDDQQRTEEPSEDERENTISDLEPSEEDAEDIEGGQGATTFRKI